MRFLLMAFILLVSTSAFAQPYGHVWLVPATDGGYESSCLFIDDDTVDLCRVAVVIVRSGDYTALESFQVTGPIIGWTWLDDASDFVVAGNSQQGASVSFAGCLSAPVTVMVILYLCEGAAPCGQLFLQGSLTLTHCDASTVSVTGSTLTVNGVFDVPPGGFDPDCYCAVVPVEKSTWGAVKALYGGE